MTTGPILQVARKAVSIRLGEPSPTMHGERCPMDWKSLPLRVKLALGFGTGLVVLIIIAATALYDSTRLTEATASRATARQFLWNLEQLLSVTRSAEDQTRGFLLTGDERFVDDLHSDVARIPAIFNDLEKGVPSQREAIRSLRPLAEAKISSLEQLVATRRKDGLQPVLARMAGGASDVQLSALRNAIGQIRDEEQRVLAARAEDARLAAMRTRVTIISGTIAAAVIMLIVAFLISRGITRRVDELVLASERVGSGDLSFRVKAGSNDEIGLLGMSFNHMAAALESQNQAIGESGTTIAERVRVLSQGSETLLDRARTQATLTREATTATDTVRSGIETIVRLASEISSLTEDSASRTTELRSLTRETHGNAEALFASVEKSSSSTMQMSAAARQMLAVGKQLSSVGDEVVSFVTEMEATTEQVRSAARSTADLSERVRQEAESGGAMVNATLSGIHASRDTTERASAALSELQSELGNVAGIISVIEDITGRTNLLALNAAIIAAQAGEHGRGFTVVANEIRELAERTRHSTEDVRSIIARVQEGSRAAVETMADGVRHVRSAVEQAGQASGALRGIVGRADESSRHTEQIVRALEDQSSGIRRLRETASRVADLIGENERAIEEQAQNAEMTAHEAERVRDVAAHVKRATEEGAIAEEGIAEAVATIDGESRRMRDLLASQQREVDVIAAATKSIRDIAQENESVAHDLAATVGVLADRASQFESQVKRIRAA
jgi:methyl-accepting chemotaxis protein